MTQPRPYDCEQTPNTDDRSALRSFAEQIIELIEDRDRMEVAFRYERRDKVRLLLASGGQLPTVGTGDVDFHKLLRDRVLTLSEDIGPGGMRLEVAATRELVTPEVLNRVWNETEEKTDVIYG